VTCSARSSAAWIGDTSSGTPSWSRPAAPGGLVELRLLVAVGVGDPPVDARRGDAGAQPDTSIGPDGRTQRPRICPVIEAK
jgi:hypothetical protein